MTKDCWLKIESLCEDLKNSVEKCREDLQEIRGMKLGTRLGNLLLDIDAEIDNINVAQESVYTTCEEDYCDTHSDFDFEKYEEVIALLPDGSKLSMGEVDSLVEHVKAWKKEFGYGEN